MHRSSSCSISSLSPLTHPAACSHQTHLRLADGHFLHDWYHYRHQYRVQELSPINVSHKSSVEKKKKNWISGEGPNIPCVFKNNDKQNDVPANPTRATNIACGNVPTVLLYSKLKTIGTITLDNECNSPIAPSTCPVWFGCTCFVNEDCNVGETIAPTASIAPDIVKGTPVVEHAYAI